jgi:peptidoglycan/LPS O-acetylase OafA/YrhL
MFAPPLLVCAGAVLLVAVCAFEQPVAKLLRAAPFVWLGRVSFSLYVVHLPVLLTLVHLLHGRFPVGLIATAAIPFTIAVAALLERWVEGPAQALARWFLKSCPRPRFARLILFFAPRLRAA